MDITKIYLSKREQKIFDKFDENGEAYLTFEEFQKLLPTGLVQERIGSARPSSKSWPTSGVCRLSGHGAEYRRYCQHQRAVDRRITRRYWITTGIAIAAFALSALSIALQYV